jgi:multimeric flavodoxin WrbA
MKALIITGSRNPEGQTARAAKAFAAGFQAGGGIVEQVFLPAMKIEHCRQCDNDGWGLCRREGRCELNDDFPPLVERVKAADIAVFATPVYFSDLSESMKAFLDRLRRVSFRWQGPKLMDGKSAIGICVAGGGGGGAPQCAVHLEKVLGTIGFDVVDMVPARRQNLSEKVALLSATGKWASAQKPPETK